MVINLVTGRYYSLDAPASQLWTELHTHKGLDIDESLFPVTEAWLNEVADEGLLIRTLEQESDTRPTSRGNTDGPFEMRAYNDLEELLKLDPIHDVDPSSGWPHAR